MGRVGIVYVMAIGSTVKIFLHSFGSVFQFTYPPLLNLIAPIPLSHEHNSSDHDIYSAIFSNLSFLSGL